MICMNRGHIGHYPPDDLYVWLACPWEVCKNCYQSVINIAGACPGGGGPRGLGPP